MLAMDLLYKYVSAERVLTCLPEAGDGTLRATQPAALNDPFECAVMKSFVERDELDGNRRHSEVLTSINSTTPVSEADVDNARHRYGSLYLRELLSRQLSQRFGIVSFATNLRHPLMWSHYTVDGSGFAIGYDRQQLSGLGSREEYLRAVRYGSSPIRLLDYPVLSEENMNPLLSYKSDHWQYEEEWRLILELNGSIGTGFKAQRGQPINLIRVPNTAVMSVYYTERTPSNVVEEIWSRLQDPNNRYAATSPTKLILSETEYGYEDSNTHPSREEP